MILMRQTAILFSIFGRRRTAPALLLASGAATKTESPPRRFRHLTYMKAISRRVAVMLEISLACDCIFPRHWRIKEFRCLRPATFAAGVMV